MDHYEISMMGGSTIIFLMGPTAVGKTDLAISLANQFSLGLISVDACQVYRGLNIGTAKPAPAVLKKYPHSLVDIRDPEDVFSAGAFCRESVGEVHRIIAKRQIPTLVGGTMFYFAALSAGLDPLPGADAQFRQDIEAEAQQFGWPALYERLERLDPQTAQRIHHNDHQRIQRALEICDQTRPTLSGSFPEQQCLPYDARVIRLGLAFSDRSVLHDRIEQRVDGMLKSGLLAEVGDLVAKGMDPQSPALRSVGYRQVYQYLNKEFDYLKMRERIIFATRQLAKRQLTWMRNTPGTVWFDAADRDITRSVGSYLMACLVDQN
jgi:tRNA dimethylallyltransferase